MTSFINNLLGVLSTFRIVDIIDILAIALVIYYSIGLVKETRAMQLVRSIGVVFVIYFLANYLDMITLKFLLQKILDVGIIVLVVLFQPELRRALERLGRSRFTEIGRIGISSSLDNIKVSEAIEAIITACGMIISRKDGALIVIERETRLGDIINTGTIVDAEPSAELIANLFFHNSPLHDGAMIIRNARVYAAGCFLPLSDTTEINKEMGTRHRAGLGMSEVSDAISIIVSEERGTISYAKESRMYEDVTPAQLREVLEEALLIPEKPKKRFFNIGDSKDEKK